MSIVDVEKVVEILDNDTRSAVARQLHVCENALRTVWQAEIVIALLRLGYDALVEKILGKPIKRLPPDPRLKPAPHAICPHKKPGKRVRYICPENPRLPTTPAWHRYRLIRRGMHVDDLLRRGVKKRDITKLTRIGFLELR